MKINASINNTLRYHYLSMVTRSVYLILLIVLYFYSPSSCSGVGGVGGVVNDFSNAPSGACCLSLTSNARTTCVEYPNEYCSTHGGDYMGNFVRCTLPQPTSPCVGACCTSSGCQEVLKSDCDVLNGVFLRAGSRCDIDMDVCNSTNTGACCFKTDFTNQLDFGSCAVETYKSCYSQNSHPPGYFWTSGSTCSMPGICPFALVPYVQALPIPDVLKPISGKKGCQGVKDGDYTPITAPSTTKIPRAEYNITATQFSFKYYPNFPNPQVAWGYEGKFPGPTIEACQGVPIEINYYNQLPNLPHPLGFDSCSHGTNFMPNVPYTSIHLHGGKTASIYDGFPESFVFPGDSYSYYYENIQYSTALNYHDHVIGITRKNVMMGLLGNYFIRSPTEPRVANYEVPLVIADRTFTLMNGQVSIYYPSNFDETFPFPSDDFPGMNIIVNGVVTPYYDATPSSYRFRIFNSANSRTLRLSFVKVGKDGSISNLHFYVIGSDQGFLYSPIQVPAITLSPLERADLVIDFTTCTSGTKVWLVNSAPFPFPKGQPRDAPYTALTSQWTPIEVLQINIKTTNGIAPTKVTLPTSLGTFPHLGISRQTRSFMISNSVVNPYGGACGSTGFTLQHFKFDGDPKQGFYQGGWDAKNYIDQNLMPLLNTVETWEFWNPLDEAHPIHIHAVLFQIVRFNNIAWDGVNYESMVISNSTIPLEPLQLGWKDIVRVPPMSVARVSMKFDQYQGKYSFHCHMLEHEDNEMMNQFRIIDSTNRCDLRSGAVCGNEVCEAGNGENCMNCPSDCLSGVNYCCGNDLESRYPTKTFIGCGPPMRVGLGATRQCQALSGSSTYLLATSCRMDYVDSCCGDGWCETLKGEYASCPLDCASGDRRYQIRVK